MVIVKRISGFFRRAVSTEPFVSMEIAPVDDGWDIKTTSGKHHRVESNEELQAFVEERLSRDVA